MVVVMCMGMVAPTVQAGETTKVKITYKGKKKNYKGVKKYAYVNNKKISVSKIPIFMKSGAYVGPVNNIFKNSSLKVSVKSAGSKLTLTYNSKVMVLKDGSRYANLNGKKTRLGSYAMYVTYPGGRKRWVVPLYSVCARLGISYKLSGGVITIGGTTNRPPATTTATTATTTEADDNTESDNRDEQTDRIVLTLDAGHGGSDAGATGNGFREKEMTLSIVRAAKKYFDKDERFKVYYTRTSDSYPSLSDRYRLANNQDSDMFISVHINSYKESSHGTETLYCNDYYYKKDDKTVTRPKYTGLARNSISSKVLADAIHKSVIATTGFTNRGLKNRTDLAVLKYTTMPACLIEYGFISNKSEARKMNENLDKYGRELYEGVVDFLKDRNKL